MDNSKNLSVLFIGHSYVRRAHLYRKDHNLPLNKLQIKNVSLNMKYYWRGGSNYKQFNDLPEIKKRILTHSPDIIIVALAGNAVSSHSSYSMPEAQEEMRIFHRWLTTSFPNAKILPIEAEPRFNKHSELPKNHPDNTESYHDRRKSMNHAINRMKGKHGTIRLFNALNEKPFSNPMNTHLMSI